GLIEAAAAEAPAPAAVHGDVIRWLETQRRLGLYLIERARAHLACEGGWIENLRQEGRRCIGGVLAGVLVVTHGGIQLPLWGEVPGRIVEQRPGVIALRVGQERGARVVTRQTRLLVDREHAIAVVHHVAGGNEAVCVHVIG